MSCFSLCYMCIFTLQKFAAPVNKNLLVYNSVETTTYVHTTCYFCYARLCAGVWIFNLSLDFPVFQPASQPISQALTLLI